MKCPKCGFQQDEGQACLHCGIVFARYRPATEFPPSKMKPDPRPVQPEISPFRRFYRIFRWASLAGLIIVLYSIFRTSPSPQIEITPEATQRAETKIQEFNKSMDQGLEKRLEMDESEVNGWLSEHLALKKSPDSNFPAPQNTDALVEPDKTATGGRPAGNEALEQAQSSVRDVKIELLEDMLRIYALVDVHGMDFSLELEGQPVVRDGYIRLEPTSGKLGSMPLMAGTLRSATDRLFSSPENKEKFKLSPNIQDIRIENSRLVIISR
jgi:hypothetical protein